MSQYLLMLYDNPVADEHLGPEQMQQIIREYSAWARRMAEESRLVAGEKLADDAGRVVRKDHERLAVTDGPFAETKEVLGGFFIIKAESYEEAVEIARTSPHAQYGASTYIRRIEDLS